MGFELCKWRLEYAANVARYANNANIACKLRDAFPYPYTIDDAIEYVESCVKNDETRQLCRAIVIDGEAVGSIGIFLGSDVYCKSAEIGYWLAEKHWGNGVMSEAIERICAEAFEKYDIARIYAEPFAGNIGSRRVLEKAGFTLEGVLRRSVFKNGKLMDSCIYAILKPGIK